RGGSGGQQHRRESRPAGAHPFPLDVHHGHGRLRAQARGTALDVHVEQGIAEHHEGPHAGTPRMRSSCAHNACTTTRCTSCTVATWSASTAMASVHNDVSGLGSGPVNAHVTIPCSWATFAAVTTF